MLQKKKQTQKDNRITGVGLTNWCNVEKWDSTNAIQILTQLYYLREVPSIQWKPLESIFKDVSDMTKSILPYGEHVCDDPVDCKKEKQS